MHAREIRPQSKLLALAFRVFQETLLCNSLGCSCSRDLCGHWLICTAFFFSSRMLHEHKIIIHVDGIEANVIKIKPPLVISKADCTHLLQALDSCLAFFQD